MELVYIICSLATAGLCEEHRAAVHSQNPMACLVGAQAEFAEITRTGWRVANWRCDAPPTDVASDGAIVIVVSD